MIELFLQNLTNKNSTEENFETSTGSMVLYYVYLRFIISSLFFISSLIAIYISWTCESNKKQFFFIRLLYAWISFMFGIFYIIANYIFKFCKK